MSKKRKVDGAYRPERTGSDDECSFSGPETAEEPDSVDETPGPVTNRFGCKVKKISKKKQRALERSFASRMVITDVGSAHTMLLRDMLVAQHKVIAQRMANMDSATTFELMRNDKHIYDVVGSSFFS